MSAGIGASFLAHSLRNVFREPSRREAANQAFYREQARRLTDQLGSLKGGVMKAGQLLALYGSYFLPDEALAELSRLQDFSQPLPFSAIAPVILRDLGRDRMSELDIDESPIGAASLGQVHRARRGTDGLDLCLKVQYPGVAASIDSDIATLSRLLLLSRLAPKGLDLTPILAELKSMLHQEVDYRRELRYTAEYAERLRTDSRFAVPRVLPDYSGARVLAMTYEPGQLVTDPRVQSLPQGRRNGLAASLLELFLIELFNWHRLQTDPNFGNYLFRIDDGGHDTIVLLDFGATREFRASFVEGYAEIVRGALLRDRSRIVRGAAAIGILREDFPQSTLDGFSSMCELMVEPFIDPQRTGPLALLWNERGEYDWARSDLPERVAVATAASTLTVHFRLPPREIVFLQRRLTGMFMMLSTLGARLDARACLRRSLGIA
jgi:predicted unusual protein kinase regulating ubiquinone biosynthesis (AarF/ABC1/UbiB family)